MASISALNVEPFRRAIRDPKDIGERTFVAKCGFGRLDEHQQPHVGRLRQVLQRPSLRVTMTAPAIADNTVSMSRTQVGHRRWVVMRGSRSGEGSVN